MDTIDKAVSYLNKAIKQLPEGDENHETLTRFLNGVESAKAMADNEEKKAIIADATIKLSNQLSFILFKKELLTDELTKEYRALPTTEETSRALEEANAARKAEYEELAKRNKEAQDKQEEIDVLQQVLGGLSKEEAEKKIEDYKNAGGR